MQYCTSLNVAIGMTVNGLSVVHRFEVAVVLQCCRM